VNLARLTAFAAVCAVGVLVGRLQPRTDVWSGTDRRHGRLPNDCEIVATEAVARIAPTGAWVRILRVVFIDRGGVPQGHAVAVWQPPTAARVAMYDQYFCAGGCTLNLDVASHNPRQIGGAIARALNLAVIEAEFLE
jgi:hypothetical protein